MATQYTFYDLKSNKQFLIDAPDNSSLRDLFNKLPTGRYQLTKTYFYIKGKDSHLPLSETITYNDTCFISKTKLQNVNTKITQFLRSIGNSSSQKTKKKAVAKIPPPNSSTSNSESLAQPINDNQSDDKTSVDLSKEKILPSTPTQSTDSLNISQSESDQGQLNLSKGEEILPPTQCTDSHSNLDQLVPETENPSQKVDADKQPENSESELLTTKPNDKPADVSKEEEIHQSTPTQSTDLPTFPNDPTQYTFYDLLSHKQFLIDAPDNSSLRDLFIKLPTGRYQLSKTYFYIKGKDSPLPPSGTITYNDTCFISKKKLQNVNSKITDFLQSKEIKSSQKTKKQGSVKSPPPNSSTSNSETKIVNDNQSDDKTSIDLSREEILLPTSTQSTDSLNISQSESDQEHLYLSKGEEILPPTQYTFYDLLSHDQFLIDAPDNSSLRDLFIKLPTGRYQLSKTYFYIKGKDSPLPPSGTITYNDTCFISKKKLQNVNSKITDFLQSKETKSSQKTKKQGSVKSPPPNSSTSNSETQIVNDNQSDDKASINVTEELSSNQLIDSTSNLDQNSQTTDNVLDSNQRNTESLSPQQTLDPFDSYSEAEKNDSFFFKHKDEYSLDATPAPNPKMKEKAEILQNAKNYFTENSYTFKTFVTFVAKKSKVDADIFESNQKEIIDILLHNTP